MHCYVSLVTRLTLSNNGLRNANAKSNQAILEVPNQSLDWCGGLHVYVWGSPCPMFWGGGAQGQGVEGARSSEV